MPFMLLLAIFEVKVFKTHYYVVLRRFWLAFHCARAKLMVKST